jgi:predicted 3-demethylubiquinone-9 3-methyltransferase (glyoxalase superfamily)
MLSVLNTRDLLTQQHRIIQQAIDSSRRENGRYSSSEIRWVKTITVADLQKQADAISQQLRQQIIGCLYPKYGASWQMNLSRSRQG